MLVYRPTQINEIVSALKNDKAAIVLTDTIFGIICKKQELIYQIKHRNYEKKIVKFINDIDALNMPKKYNDEMKKYLPGKLTFIYQGNGYRIPNDKLLLQLIKIVGPLYCSSANITNQPPITHINQSQAIFKEYEDEIFLIDKGTSTKNSCPSTIIDLDRKIILRHGEIDGEKILKNLF